MTGKELYEKEAPPQAQAWDFLSVDQQRWWNDNAASTQGTADNAKNQRVSEADQRARMSEADQRARDHELHPVERIENLERFVTACRAMFKHMGLKLPELSEPAPKKD